MYEVLLERVAERDLKRISAPLFERIVRRIADLARDRRLLEAAREDADRLVQADPALGAAELAGLRRRISRLRRQPG